MKYFVVILTAVVLVQVAGQWKPKTFADMVRIRNECLKINPLSKELLAKLDVLEYPNVEPMQKHILCTMTKLEVFDACKGYDPLRLAKTFHGNLTTADILPDATRCAKDKNQQKSSLHEWAWRAHQCLYDSKNGKRVRAYNLEQIKKLKEQKTKL